MTWIKHEECITDEFTIMMGNIDIIDEIEFFIDYDKVGRLSTTYLTVMPEWHSYELVDKVLDRLDETIGLKRKYARIDSDWCIEVFYEVETEISQNLDDLIILDSDGCYDEHLSNDSYEFMVEIYEETGSFRLELYISEFDKSADHDGIVEFNGFISDKRIDGFFNTFEELKKFLKIIMENYK